MNTPDPALLSFLAKLGGGLLTLLGLVFALFKMLHRRGDERHADLKTDVREGFAHLRQDLREMRTHMGEVRQDVAEVRQDLGDIKARMQDFVTREEHRKSIERTHARIDDVTARVDRFERERREAR